jgi:tRNA(adenine34) deaminase
MATRSRKKSATRSSTKKASSQKSAGKKKRSGRKWVRTVTTDSTHPPEGLFKKDAKTIARSLASKKVSPKGIGSGIRMVQYFINRGGKNLSATRRRELEKAKRILQEMSEKEKAAESKA